MMLLKEQSTVYYIHGKIAPTISIIHKEIKDSIKISKSKLTLTLTDLGYTYKMGYNRSLFSINNMCLVTPIL
jgi:hypothetical protein